MDTLLQDLRLAARGLARAPGFTLVAALTLALGIGANTAIFSVLYAVLLRPLPYAAPDQLVGLAQTYQGNRGVLAVAYREFQFLQEHGRDVAEIAVATDVGFNVSGGAIAERVDGLRVSANYFRTLGARPELGRDFVAGEDQPGGANAVILSQGFWQRRFGGDPSIVGRTVSLDGQPYEVVGVMPASFRDLEPVDAWSTIAQVGRTIGGGQNLRFVARLRPDLPLDRARERLAAVIAAFGEEFKPRLPAEVAIDVHPLRELIASDLQTPVRVLFGAIGLVLLIACANVASLVLGRATSRGRELAVRIAVGATRVRLMRQLLTESVLLAGLGGALGLAFAVWGLGVLVSLVPPDLTRVGDIRLDRWALLFTAVTSLVVGIGFGLVPAWHAARTSPHDALREGSGRSRSAAREGRLRHALVVGEVALSLVLLIGAGLLLRTVANLTRTDPGFDPRRVLAAEIWLTGSGHDSTEQIAGLYDRMATALEALPGVSSAAVVEAGIPLVRGGNMGVAVDGEYPRETINYRTVTPGYFETMRIPVLHGRTFAASDAGGGEPVAIVSESFARRFLGGEGLGRWITVGGRSQPPRRVVGVVGDVKQFVGAPALPTAFIPSSQTPAAFTRLFSSWFPTHVVLRTAGEPAPLREAVTRVIRDVDPRVPVGRVRAMDEVLASSLAFQRFIMVLLSGFAGLAITLAAVGIYGVISYLVAQRTHEFGVRMALGARSADVVRLVLGRGLRLAGLGVAVGVAGALGLTRLLTNQLYRVRPADPATFVAVTSLLLLVALAACYVPARRATRIDPMEALRSE